MMKEIARILERYNPSDNIGIAHPIHEEELSKDVMYLVACVRFFRKQSQKRLASWHEANKIILSLEDENKELFRQLAEFTASEVRNETSND